MPEPFVSLSFDNVVKTPFKRKNINYGILIGNEKIVFIKSGCGRDLIKPNNKYLKMAHRVHERLGATVICASNPYIEGGHIMADKAMILEIISQIKLSNFELYFVGVSDGAYHNLLLANEFTETVKILGINSSRKTPEDLKEKLFALENIPKILVYGTKDYERDIIPFLKKINPDNTKIINIEGANHEFEGMEKEFIELIDLI